MFINKKENALIFKWLIKIFQRRKAIYIHIKSIIKLNEVDFYPYVTLGYKHLSQWNRG